MPKSYTIEKVILKYKLYQIKSMTKLDVWTKVGPKGQIVLRKEIREAIGVKPGSVVRLMKTDHEVKIKPLNPEEIIADVDRIAKMIGKKWPKGKTSVDIIREERDRKWQ